MNKIRPLIQSSSEYLFISFSGKHNREVGREVPRFFRTSSLQLHLTTTGVRVLVETCAEWAMRKGMITSEEREAISGLNGHSSAITKKYYVFLDRGSEISQAQALFSLPALSSTDSPFLPSTCPPQQPASTNDIDALSTDLLPLPLQLEAIAPPGWAMREDLRHKQWGASHPCQAVNPKKVVWSDEELNYLRQWLEDQMRLFPDLEHNTACWRALEHINNCPQARAVFHRNHVLTTGRLRSGFDNLMPRMRKDKDV